MNCFENIVGIKNCNSTQYEYWLDGYGLSLKQLEAIADESAISGKQLFKDISEQAYLSLFNDITFKGFNANKILQEINLKADTCTEYGNFGIERPSNIKEIEFNCYNRDCELINFYLNSIKLHVKQGGNTTISIKYNGVTQVLFSGVVDSDAIVNIEIPSVQGFLSSTFSILVDLTNISVCSGNFNSDCSACGVFYTKSSEINYGFEVDMRVQCDKSIWICKHKDLLVQAYIYKILGLYWHRRYLSDRVKESDRNYEVANMNFYDSIYNAVVPKESSPSGKGMYQLELEKANKAILPPKCRCCIECESNINYKISIR